MRVAMMRILAQLLLVLVALLPAPVPADPADEQILIYIANETRLEILDSPNYRFFLGVLRNMDDPDASLNAAFLETDAERFSAATGSETRALLEAPLPPGLIIAIVTNSGLIEGMVLLRDRQGVHRLPVKARANPADPVIRESPVMDRPVLTAALDVILVAADAPEARIAMILKSHGSQTMALMPRLSADSSRATPEAVRDYFARFGQPGTTRPDWNRVRGLSKDVFYALLDAWAVRHRRSIDLVIVESCSGGLQALDDRFLLPSTIRQVLTSGSDYVQYRNFRYRDILSSAGPVGVIARLTAEAGRIGLLPELGTP